MSFNFDCDRLFNDIDRNLSESRKTFSDFDLKFGSGSEMSEEKWSELFDRAMSRHHDECSICMNKYQFPKV
jgi:hypothetical protein